MAFVRGLLPKFLLIIIFSGILVLIVALARGYRFNFEERKITSTGILSVNSAPEAAKIYINDELKGVTNQNITLPPGNYRLKLVKDGFTEWQKEVKVLGEVVYSFEAVLFPKNPSLSPLTNLGILKAIPVGEADKLLIFTQTGNIEKDGIYMLEGNPSRISLLSPLKPIMLLSALPLGTRLESTHVDFSADYSEGVFTFETEDGSIYSYVLSLTGQNTDPLQVTGAEATITDAWEADKKKNLQKILETFPKQIKAVATDSFRIIAFSPDETKILYQARKASEVPLALKERVIGANQTDEHRTLEEGKVYVYDRKEDRNFLIPLDSDRISSATPSPTITPIESIDEVVQEESIEATDTPQIESSAYNKVDIFDYVQWYPSSRHLIVNEGKTISIMSYDGTNKQSIYSGPYETSFFALNSDWKLLVLANLNPQNNAFGDIYEIGIR